jgi:DNA-binding transcriptional LysR family regulator
MNQNHIRSLDLNLLKVLEALLEEGGVTAAARRLNLTQSAVSHALNRLRQRIGDPLFVRSPSGMRPTPRALEIGSQVRDALAQLQAALEPARFDPTAARQFSLSASGYVCAVLLPDLLAQLQEEAPRTKLRVSHLGAGTVTSLEQGRIDLAVGGFGRVPERFAKQRLFEDALVWVMRAGHPLAGEPLTLEALAGVTHLVIGAGEDPVPGSETLIDHGLERRVMLSGGEALHSALAARGLRRRVAAVLPGGDTALTLIAASDMMALLPRRLVPTGGFKVFEPPHPAPALEMSMIWRKDQDSPAAAWFRLRLARSAGRLTGETGG